VHSFFFLDRLSVFLAVEKLPNVLVFSAEKNKNYEKEDFEDLLIIRFQKLFCNLNIQTEPIPANLVMKPTVPVSTWIFVIVVPYLPVLPPPPPLRYLSTDNFCCAGDVNAIADTVIHAQIYKYLIDLHEILVRIRANQAGYIF
jgi:hypothetical protein